MELNVRCPRAWDDVAGRMCYAKPEQFDDMLGFRFDHHFQTEKPIYMWSTGVRSDDNRELYEGDIVIAHNMLSEMYAPYKAIIEWDKFRFALRNLDVNHSPDNSSIFRSFSTMVNLDPFGMSIRLIGNCHETPELLEVTE